MAAIALNILLTFHSHLETLKNNNREMYVNKVLPNVIIILFCSTATSYFVHGLPQRNSSTKSPLRLKVTSGTSRIPVDPKKIAREKCVEYAAYRFINEAVASPLIGDSIRDCKKIDKSVVRLSNADEKEFPHAAVIGSGENISNIEWFCGGSLISEQYILTAAHCVAVPDHIKPPKWALLGLTSTRHVTADKLNKNLFRIVASFVHPSYRTQNNDIALLKLKEPLVLKPTIRPVCLHTSEDLATDSNVTATGWTKTNIVVDIFKELVKVTIRIQNNELCVTNYRDDLRLVNGFNAKSMVCAEDPFNTEDPCEEGDSGGPIQVPLGDDYECMWTQIAITSISASIFCYNKIPSIYTKVSHFLPWIQGIVWPQNS